MNRKVFHVIYIILFVLMLLVPMVFVNPYGGIVSKQENRMLAARPPISRLFRHPKDFIRKFDAWFSDNVGFREKLINLYKELGLGIVGQRQFTDGNYVYLVGKQDHRYFAGVDGEMISKFQGNTLLNSKELQILSSKLNEIKQYLDERNMPFIVMFCTDKESVYPEYYPETIKRGPEPIQLDIITKYLKENTDVDIFNIRQRLLAEKKNYLLYNKAAGDLTHYNEIGAFFAYCELMKHITVYMPEIQPFTIDDIDINDKNDIPSVSLKRKITYRKLDPSFFDNVDLHRPFTLENVAFENNDPTLPTIMFLSDSYAYFLTRYIPEHFGKTILIHYRDMNHLEEYINLYKPNIVVFETAERQLKWFANVISTK